MFASGYHWQEENSTSYKIGYLHVPRLQKPTQVKFVPASTPSCFQGKLLATNIQSTNPIPESDDTGEWLLHPKSLGPWKQQLQNLPSQSPPPPFFPWSCFKAGWDLPSTLKWLQRRIWFRAGVRLWLLGPLLWSPHTYQCLVWRRGAQPSLCPSAQPMLGRVRLRESFLSPFPLPMTDALVGQAMSPLPFPSQFLARFYLYRQPVLAMVRERD